MPDIYTAVFHPPENGSEVGVTFPDLPGCVSSGATVADALVNAAEALSGHLAVMKADGDPLPPQRHLRDLLKDADFAADIAAGATVAPITARDVPPPKERINIMIARDVLKSIDAAAAQRGLSRSAYIETVAGKAASKRWV